LIGGARRSPDGFLVRGRVLKCLIADGVKGREFVPCQGSYFQIPEFSGQPAAAERNASVGPKGILVLHIEARQNIVVEINLDAFARHRDPQRIPFPGLELEIQGGETEVNRVAIGA